jgi:ketosteroid isomerase-like protein
MLLAARRKEETVGEAREVMDRLTETLFTKDLEAAARLYSPNAVAITPDQGEVRGAENIVKYLKEFMDAFPDAEYEHSYSHESGNTAIDEGYLVGTHSGPLASPTGESVPATGKRIRARSCDIASVENGVITSHRFYFDQLEFLGQLGLLPEEAASS